MVILDKYIWSLTNNSILLSIYCFRRLGWGKVVPLGLVNVAINVIYYNL